MKFLLCALLALCPLYYAEAAIDPAIIPADSRWVIYADLNTLRSTSPGKELVAAAENQHLQAGHAMVGIDVQKVLATVGKVTAFGSNLSSNPRAVDGTLVLQGTPDLRKITEGLLLQQTVAHPESAAEIKDLPFPAYMIRSPHQAPRRASDATATTPSPAAEPPPELIVAFPPEPIVIVSKSRAQILNAREAFRGSAPSLARTLNAPLHGLLQNAGEAYLFAASVVPSEEFFPADQPQARILRMTTSGAFAIGQEGADTHAHIVLVAPTDDTADKLTKILQGITAMLSLAETNDKQLADFLNSTRVTQNERVVSLDLSYSSARLAQMVTELLTQAHPRRGPERFAGRPHGFSLSGDVIAQWQAQPAAPGTAEPSRAPITRSIDNVTLENGAIISLAHQTNGGKVARFERVEITPTTGGTPLSFRTSLMRTIGGGPGGQAAVFEFPGADGTYNLRVTYLNDPEGKAAYTITVRPPKPESKIEPKAAPTESKSLPKDSE